MGIRAKKSKGFIVTIDGPSGAGKSTVSKMLAETLHGFLLDTGAMYRSVAYFAIQSSTETAKGLSDITRKLDFKIDPKTKGLLVNDEPIGPKLRAPKVSQMASHIGKFKGVRKVLTVRQRKLANQLAKSQPIVVEGRDIGTVVFPKAKYKFFVSASVDVRAKRRYQQLKSQEVKGVSYAEVLKQQKQRDAQDMNRKIAPLKCPEDAVIVDTSEMGVQQVVHFLATHIQRSEIEKG